MAEEQPGATPPPHSDPETDFGGVFEEVNTQKDPLEIEYENFKVLMKKEKLNVFSAILDFKNGKRKPLGDIYKAHPELKILLAEEMDELIHKYQKEVIGLIYSNFNSLKNVSNFQPGDLELLLDDGNEFLQLFKELRAQNPEQKKDYFVVLEEYLKAKQEAERTDNPEKVAMSLFFLNNEPLEKLIPRLDKLSGRLGREVIANLVRRPEDEKKLTELSKKTEPVREIVNFYGTANDHLSRLLDNFQNYSQLYEADKGNEAPESLMMLKEFLDIVIKNELRQVTKAQEARKLFAQMSEIKDIDELREAEKHFRKLDNSILDMGEYKNYKNMLPEGLERARIEYETFLALPDKQVFDLQTLASLGELIEKRVNYFHKVFAQHAELSKKYSTEYDWH